MKYILNWSLLVSSKTLTLMETHHWEFSGTRIKHFAETTLRMRRIKILLISDKCRARNIEQKLSSRFVCVTISNSFANADQPLWSRGTIRAQGLAKKSRET